VAQCWGAGGGGGGGDATSGGSGGGGGGFSQKTLAVTPGTVYTVNVGLGGTAGAASGAGGVGGDSWFSSNSTVLAKVALVVVVALTRQVPEMSEGQVPQAGRSEAHNGVYMEVPVATVGRVVGAVRLPKTLLAAVVALEVLIILALLVLVV
jgi:hypothetical protein